MHFIKTLLFSLVALTLSVPALAADAVKTLPAPVKTGGMPLMQAFAERHTDRNISDKTVDEQTLSNLLWATFGVSRPDGKRTAPTAMNSQNVTVYVALSDGVWEYEGKEHALKQISTAPLAAPLNDAPVILLYAAPDKGDAAMHVGSIYQNAGLFCTSVGLSNVVRTSNVVKPESLALLNLPQGKKVYVAQSIGWPK